MNRTVWMFFTFVAASCWFWELRVNVELRTQNHLRSRITTLTAAHCVQTHETNRMCLDTLNQVRNLLDYRGREGAPPGLGMLISGTLKPGSSTAGMGGGE